MTSLSLKYGVAFAAALVLAGCATTPSVGSKKWHTTRLVEIEMAYENDEIPKETYLSLKNEADQTRVEYQENFRRQVRSRRYISFPHHHHFSHHH